MPIAFYVDVLWLIAVTRVEEESIRTRSKDRGHAENSTLTRRSHYRHRLSPNTHQSHRTNRHCLASRHQMLDLAILIRLMRHLQNPRAISNALLDACDSGEVLLIISTRTGDQWRLTSSDFANDTAHCLHQRR